MDQERISPIGVNYNTVVSQVVAGYIISYICQGVIGPILEVAAEVLPEL